MGAWRSVRVIREGKATGQMEQHSGYFEQHRLGNRLLFQASRDSLLSLVGSTRLQRRLSFLSFLLMALASRRLSAST